MNVYFIGQKGIPSRGGGVERHVEELVKQLAPKGLNIYVYSRKGYTESDLEIFNGANILYTKAVYTKHLEAISHTFFSILDLRKRDVDVVHFHSIGPSLLIPLVRILKPRAKVVATVHSPDYHHQKWNWFARKMLRFGEFIANKFAHKVITVSQAQKAYLWQAYRTDATYIPNGVNRPEMNSDSRLLQEWDLQPNQYFVAISRLVRHKGLHYLIDAYKKLKTDKKLVIVGGAAYTEDYVQELQTMAADNNKIIFTGNQSGEKLRALFEHAYAYINPSLSEGLSISLLEALSFNQAVLASDIPENMEVIKDVGFSFEKANVNDLAKKLNFLISHPEIVKQYKLLGREHIQKNYSWNDIAEKTAKVYQS